MGPGGILRLVSEDLSLAAWGDMRNTRRPLGRPVFGSALPNSRAGKLLAFALALGLVGAAAPMVASAYPTPGPVSSNGAPARFLPAPNETAYCESVDYFGPWSKNLALTENNGMIDIEPLIDQDGDGYYNNDTARQSIVNDTATTGPTEVTASFERLTAGGANAGITTPAILYGSNSDLGIVLNGPAHSKVTLSEPMFYSQWVFTDVDSNTEGFEVQPNWATGYGNEILMTSAVTSMPSSGDASQIRFVKSGDAGTDGYWLKGRVQTDFLGAISGYEFTKMGPGNAGSGFVGGAGCLPFGVAKSASEPVFNATTGEFSVDYTILVRNTLPSTSQLLEKLNSAISNTSGQGYEYRLTDVPTGINQTVMQIAEPLEAPGFSDVNVSDLKAEGLTINSGFNGKTNTNLLTGSDTLAPQTTGKVTFTATYKPDINDAAWDDCSNSVSNSATATAQAQGVAISDKSDNGTNPSPTNDNGSGTTDDPTSVTFELGCSLSIDKSVGSLQTDADGSGDISVGDTLSYTVTATNTGAANLSNVYVSDPDLNDSSKDCELVAPAGTCVLTGSYQVTATDFAAGKKVNTATVDADQAEGVSDSSTTPIPQPAMSLAKSAGSLTGDADSSGDISAGDTLTYTLTATNTGTANLTNVKINDPILTMTPKPYVCAGPIEPGETCVATGTYKVTADDVDTGHRDNTGSATADQISTAVSASSTTPIGRPKLTLEKSVGVLTTDADSSGDISEGDTLTYTITATSSGTAALTGLTISDPDLTLTPDPFVCDSPLQPAKTCVATGTYVVTNADVAAGFKSNTATADADQSHAVTATSITSLPYPELKITKAAPVLANDADSSGDISVGDILGYTVTARNTGEATLTAVSISDPSTTPSSKDCGTLAKDEECFLTASHVVTADDVAGGRIDNTATANSAQTEPVTASRSIAVPKPGAVVTKPAPTLATDADGSGDISVGDTLQYAVRLTNTGAAALTNVVVSDPQLTPSSKTCAGPIAAGEVCELTGTRTVTADDVAAKKIMNSATGDSDQTAQATAERTTPLRTPALTLAKSTPTLENDADSSGDVSAGDQVRFTVTATNTGTANLTNVVVTDDHITPTTTTCAGPIIPAGTCVLTGLYTVTASDVAAGTLTNTATADTTQTATVTDSVETKLNEPALGIEKAVPTNSDEDESGDISVGDILTYTITATNIGTATLTDLAVSDPMITKTADDCAGATLESGEACELIGTYRVTESDVTAGQIENVATADSTQTDEVTDQVSVAVQTPELEVVKSEAVNTDEDGSGDVSVGDTLTYTVTATNVGGANLTGVTVSDPNLAGDGSTNCAGPLKSDDECVLTGSHVVTADDLTTGKFVNTATADSVQTSAVTDTIETPAPTPAITLIKEYASNADEDGSTDISLGDTLTYTVTATNVGAANLNKVVISDPKLSPATFECAGPIAADETCVLSGTYTVTAADVKKGSIKNTAEVDALQIDKSETAETTIRVPTPKMTLLKDAPTNDDDDGSGDISVGDTLTYKVVAHNVGTARLTEITVTDPLLTPDSVTCAGPIAPGGTCQLTGTYQVSADDLKAGQIINTASAVAEQGVQGTGERVVVVPEPQLGLEKGLPANADEDGSGDISAGDTLTYTVIATNTGQANLLDVEVNDPKITPSATSCAGPVLIGETCELSGTYTVTAEDVAAGKIDNTATVNSRETAEAVTAENQVPLYEPELTIEKPAPDNADEDASGDISPGDTLTYTITVTNIGGGSATNVVIVDELIAPTTKTCTGPVKSGEACVLKGSYQVTPADILAGLITNTATASSNQTDEISAEVSVATTGRVDVAVTKTVDRSEASLHDEVTYTITVINHGPAGALDVQVEDEQPAGLEFLTTAPSVGEMSGAVWSVGDLAVGESASLTITARVTETGTITNIASASAADPDGGRLAERDMENNVAAVVVEVPAILFPMLPNTGGGALWWTSLLLVAVIGGFGLYGYSRAQRFNA